MLIGGFNEACTNTYVSYLKVGDDSMVAIRFWTTLKGNLPHLSYIFRKPVTLGTEFKIVACYVNRALIFIEIQIGKEVVKNRKYHMELGSTETCTQMMTEDTK